MSGTVTFYWLDDDGDPYYVRVPRDEVRAIRLDHDTLEIQLTGAYQDVNISLDPKDDGDKDQIRALAVKMVKSIRSLTDEDVSWEWDGSHWNKQKAKNHEVWGAS